MHTDVKSLSIPYVFRCPLYEASEIYERMAVSADADSRDDYYTALSIEILAAVPQNTVMANKWPHISFVFGSGALLSFMRLRMGKKENVDEFRMACDGLAQYIKGNFTKTQRQIDTLSCETVALDILLRAERNTGIITTLNAMGMKLSILFLPDEAQACHKVSVYSKEILKHAKPITGYTIVIPAGMEGKPPSELMQAAFASALSICISDVAMRQGEESIALGAEVYAEWRSCMGRLDRYVLQGQIYRGENEIDAVHMKRVGMLYKPIAAYLLGVNDDKTEQLLTAVGTRDTRTELTV